MRALRNVKRDQLFLLIVIIIFGAWREAGEVGGWLDPGRAPAPGVWNPDSSGVAPVASTGRRTSA